MAAVKLPSALAFPFPVTAGPHAESAGTAAGLSPAARLVG